MLPLGRIPLTRMAMVSTRAVVNPTPLGGAVNSLNLKFATKDFVHPKGLSIVSMESSGVRHFLALRTPFIVTNRPFSSSSKLFEADKGVTTTATTTGAISSTPTSAVSADTAPTSVDAVKESISDLIPDKPLPISLAEGQVLTEPTLESLGLASWWPAGRFQYLMENIHLGLDVPWWATIMIMTLGLRILVFPLVVMSQKNAAKLNNISPQLTKLQEEMTEARRRGDMYQSQVVGMEMQKLMTDHNVNPLKNMVPILFQLPFFMSMFIGLRGMCNLPVESMTRGGLLWFEDLTLADPFYTLPIMTSASLYLQFKFAADGANLQNLGPIGQGVMKGMPVILLLFTMNFPSAITFYWFFTNLISIVQARLVRIKMLRELLGIPDFKKQKKIQKQKGFFSSVKESIDNFKVQADVAERRSYDEQAFREAGLAKSKRTYRFDPTKPQLK